VTKHGVAGLFVSQRKGSHSAGISCTTHDVFSVGGSVWYMIRKLRCTVTINTYLANSKTQNAFVFFVHAMFRHDCPLAVKSASTPRRLVHRRTWRDSVSIDVLLSAVSVLVVAQPSWEIPEGLMNYPVFLLFSKVFTDLSSREVLFSWFRSQIM
jgi:hypothetical protein